MALPDVHVAEPITGGQYWREEVALLNVHVVGVHLQLDPRIAQLVEEGEGARDRVARFDSYRLGL